MFLIFGPNTHIDQIKMCECNLDTKLYRDLQRQLKIYAVCGYKLEVSLNKSKAILQAELERLKGEAPPAREYKPQGKQAPKKRASKIPTILTPYKKEPKKGPEPEPEPKPKQKAKPKPPAFQREEPERIQFGALKAGIKKKASKVEEFKPTPATFGSLRR
jgi:hypothetical protein